MQTSLLDKYKTSDLGQQAESILRKCVHCGFCLATCPTYDLLGNELDSPRGRIYQIKQVLEGVEPTEKTQLHLDRCLTCRNCETTCPSGVEYGHLVDAGRAIVEESVPRSLGQRLLRKSIRTVLPYTNRVKPLIKLGQLFSPLLPESIASHVPVKQAAGLWPAARHSRKMLILDGCVQPAMAPAINAATARVLDKLKISLIACKQAGCCGALSFHLNAQTDGLDFARANIDAWWPEIESGAEAIVTTASGCGVFVKDYGNLLKDDPVYAEKAARITALCKDISEVIAAEDISVLKTENNAEKPLAFHPPCTLQHGQKLPGKTEALLQNLGFNLVKVKDAHFCCGSAGTYSITQKSLSQRLLKRKIGSLLKNKPRTIATANIGCLLHLQSAAGDTPVLHWIQLLDDSHALSTDIPT
ncbi:glycolate oxidase iron-sulfur subunit [Chromatiales bacterium (ex Bugula neritina AB1)]|nr:glycolate oxidase iron-sulfur subunit [Chromatiales bacterium (ex Bugula neritina AB1)]